MKKTYNLLENIFGNFVPLRATRMVLCCAMQIITLIRTCVGYSLMYFIEAVVIFSRLFTRSILMRQTL
jgi:hypothetical protein